MDSDQNLFLEYYRQATPTPGAAIRCLSLSVTPTTFAENAGTNAAKGTVTRNNSSGQLTVNLRSSHTHKATMPATVTFADGESTTDFSIDAVDDDIIGKTQIVDFTVSAAGYADVTTSVTITENDFPPPGVPQFATDSVEVEEYEQSVTLTVSRVDGSYGELTAKYATVNGTAIEGKDYVSANGTLTWEDGDNGDKTLTVTIIHDVELEDDETFTVTLSDFENNELDKVTVIIKDNPNVLQFSASNYSVSENREQACILVTRNNANNDAISVDYGTSDDTAMADNDYRESIGTLSWDEGDFTDKPFTIDIINDIEAEKNETLIISLGNVTGGASLGEPNSAILTILDDENNKLPESATLRAPLGTINDDSPNYIWQEVTPSSWYYLWINDATDTPILNQWYKASEVCCGNICQMTPTKNLEDGKHRWWIQTWNSAGYGEWSSGMDFTVTLTKPPAAELIKPKKIISKTPRYTWKAVDNASWYYLWINDSKGKRFTKWYRDSEVDCGTGICQIELTESLENGTYIWWIQTWNRKGYGEWSDGMTFTILPAPTLIEPTGIIYNKTPVYKWNAVETATWYYLWVNDSKGERFTKWYEASEVGCSDGTGICQIEMPESLENGNHTWWIQAWNSAGYGPWSDGMTFNVAILPPLAAELIEPNGTINEQTPIYKWHAVNTSTWYYLWINDSKGKRFEKWYTANEVGCGEGTGTCQIEPTENLANGNYTWWVQTWNDVGYGPWSQAMPFDVQ